MNEENEVNETVETEAVEAIEYTGIAAAVNAEIEQLTDVLTEAVNLESGLDTQAAIKKSALELRKGLLSVSKTLHAMRSDVMDVKESLLESVGEVQSTKKKEALLAKKQEIEEALAEM